MCISGNVLPKKIKNTKYVISNMNTVKPSHVTVQRNGTFPSFCPSLDKNLLKLNTACIQHYMYSRLSGFVDELSNDFIVAKHGNSGFFILLENT